MASPWIIELHDEVFAWLVGLSEEKQERIRDVLHVLEQVGPRLGRPHADTVRGSSFANMKELRVGTMRILFAFDPRRRAVLLVGGDKRGRWQEWYAEAIPIADARFVEWLEGEGASSWDS